MLGFSIFLGESISKEKTEYIHSMVNQGFTRMFTSLHIPEETTQSIFKHLEELGRIAKRHNLEIMADVSAAGLRKIGIDLSSSQAIDQLIEKGITGVRIDDGLPNQMIAELSSQLKIGLNASTLTSKDVEELRKSNADFSKIELWHNYYPRPNTGLDESYLKERNQKFSNLGMKIFAFIPGNDRLRGPLYETLPTLESHRYSHPLATAIDLLTNFSCDGVCVGDEGLTKKVQAQFFSYFNQQVVQLFVDVVDRTHAELFIGTHTNRLDEARDVVRSQEARFKEMPWIEQNNSEIRNIGSITLDNHLYQRYMGELQLTKVDLPLDEKVNVVAKVIQPDQGLIQFIRSGTRFELIERTECSEWI